MNKLMAELMAEAHRVNALEIEVERTIDRQKEEIKQSRIQKAQEIESFLSELLDALIEADALQNKYNASFFVVTGAAYEHDRYMRTVGITFRSGGIWTGGYYIGSDTCTREERFERAISKGPMYPSMKALIDAWNPEMERNMESAVAAHIKETLAQRMEKLQKDLKRSNDNYAKYIKER